MRAAIHILSWAPLMAEHQLAGVTIQGSLGLAGVGGAVGSGQGR